MKKLIENITGGYSSSASVIDGNLIISLPDAIAPVVWRMDLKKIEASSLEVRDNKDDTFTLTFKTDKGQKEDVAPFDSRAKAVKALMVVSAAMHRTGGTYSAINDSTQSAAAGTSINNNSSGSKWAGTLAGVVILGVLVYILMNISPSQPVAMEGAATQSSAFSSTGSGQNAGKTSGIPQSADDFLMGR